MNNKYSIKTIRGYDFFEASSAMQKAIRRGDVAVAGYFALELWHSGYKDYVWKRLFTISAEDCAGFMTQEIEALMVGYDKVNEGKPKEEKGRIFISKAVILLCLCMKNRDADHLQNFIYDKYKVGYDEIDKRLAEVRQGEEYVPIPNYAYDCHTFIGRKRGKNKAQFFKEELEALHPRQKGLFDDVINHP